MYLNDAASDTIQHGSKESPIQIQQKNPNRQIVWEYDHILRTIGRYKNDGQALLLVNGKYIDQIKVTDCSGRKHAFYFDVSSKLEKDGKELERAWEEMKRHPEKLPPELRSLIGRVGRQGQ